MVSLALAANSPAAIFGPSAVFTRKTLMRPSAQTTVKPSAATSTISPILPPIPLGSRAGHGLASPALLAADSLGVARRQRLRLEDLQCRAVQRGPRARRRIAAADEIVDLLPGLAPIDARIVPPATALVARLGMILLDARRLAGLDQVDRLQRRLDSHGKQPVEINRTERVVGTDMR